MALDKNDLFLVVRDGASHRITAGEMKAHFGGTFGSIRKPEVITPPNNDEIVLDKLTGEPYPETESDWANRRELRFTSTALEYDGDPVTYAYRTWIIEQSEQPYINLPGYKPWEILVTENDLSGPETRDEGWDPGSWNFAKGTHYRVNVRYVGSDSEVSPASEWNYFYTDPEIPDEPEDPEAILQGLRFDNLRETRLQASINHNSSTYTVSFWAKPTSITSGGGVQQIFSLSQSTWGPIINMQGGYWGIYDNIAHRNSSKTVDLNVWSHVVVQVINNTAEMFVNNSSVLSGLTMPAADGSGYIIGDNNDPGDKYGFNGYLSDFYYVDGSTVDCSVFGQSLSSGAWGPRNPEDIKDAIDNFTPKSPYDQRPNMERDWSGAGLTEGSVNDLSDMFDGNMASHVYYADGVGGNGYYTYTFSPALTGVSRIRISAWDDGVPDSGVSGSGLIVNGNDYGSLVPIDQGWIEIPESNLESIRVKGGSGVYAVYVAAIEVEGRILVDGPADNSQNWSDFTNGVVSSSSFPIAKMYDGVLTLNDAALVAENETITANLTSATGSTAKIYYQNGSDTSGTSITRNGSALAITKAKDTVLTVDVDISDTGNLGTLIASGHTGGAVASNDFGIIGIEIDGKVLVDSGAQFNTSRAWRDTLNTNVTDAVFPLGIGAAFDGSAETQIRSEAIGKYLQFDLNLTGVTSLQLVSDMGNSATIYTNDDSGGENSVASELGKTPQDIPFATSGNVDYIKIWSAGDYVYLSQIIVNGQILVDSAGGFGENGFYLPFDPEATGKIWSDASTGSFNLDRLATYAFDGDLSTYANPALPSNGLSEATFNFSPPIASGTLDCLSDLQLRYTGSSSLRAGIKVNGVNRTQAVFGQDPTTGPSVDISKDWFTLTSADGAGISSVTIITANEGATYEGTAIYAFKENGRLLVDHNNIGVDASGNGNNFHDDSFAVGNTSQVWSDGLIPTDLNSDAPKTNAFNGNISDYAIKTGSSLQWVGSIPFNHKVEVYFNSFNASQTYSANNNEVTGSVTDGSQWTELTGLSSPFTELTIAADGRLGAIRVDGVILIDSNIQDTVRDNPVKNYNVASTGINGNLQMNNSPSASRGTIHFAAGQQYYMETYVSGATTNIGIDDITTGALWENGGNTTNMTVISGDPSAGYANGDIIGVASSGDTLDYFKNSEHVFSATTTKTSNVTWSVGGGVGEFSNINCGQMPFAASNVTENLDEDGRFDGTVTLASGGPLLGNWTDGSFTGSMDYPWENAFDGDTSTYAGANTASVITFTNPIPINGKKVEVFGAAQGGDLLINGVSMALGSPNNSTSRWVDNTDALSGQPAITNISLTAGQTAVMAGLRIDGRVLVMQKGDQNQSQVWSSSVSVDGTTLAGDTVTSVFNGQTSGGGLRTHNTADSTYTLTFDNPPTVTDKVTLYFWGETSSNGTAVINDGTDNVIVDFNGSKTDGTPFEATGVTQLKNIKFSSGDNGSPSVGVSALAVDGKMLVDASGFPGGTYNTLYEQLPDYMRSGRLFYSEKLCDTIHYTQLKGYGVTPANCYEVGIYPLSEQPKYPPISYVRKGNYYCPVYDYPSILADLSDQLDECIDEYGGVTVVEGSGDTVDYGNGGGY